MAKAPKRGSSTTKSTRSRDARRALVNQSAHKRAKSQSVKHVPKARLEEVTAELDSQLAHVQTLYTVRQTPASVNGEAVRSADISVEGLGDILRGM